MLPSSRVEMSDGVLLCVSWEDTGRMAGPDMHSNAALREPARALSLVSSSLSSQQVTPAAAKTISVPPAKDLGAGAELGREDTAGSGCVTLGTLAIL